MKLAFFSNFLNHHQLPLCLEFYNNPEIDFSFVACDKIPQDRLDMGYEDMNTAYPFVVRAYESKELALDIAKSYDVVIFGASPAEYIDLRMKENKLSFRFCERSLKKGTWRRFIPQTRKKIHNEYVRYRKKDLYILGASSYTASDLALCGFPIKKCFQWGYFPKTDEQNIDELFSLKEQNNVTEILYAGRLLKLKHVIDIVKAVNLLPADTSVHLTIIGDGEAKEEIVQYVKENKLEDAVTLLPFMSPEEVRVYMDKADIYVFSSNFYEGWGAVVNEAMNSACSLIVSHAVGSAKYLIDNGKNGYIYTFANVNELSEKINALANDKALRKEFGKNAYKTVTEIWSAKNAAQRFLELCNCIQEGKDYRALFTAGPCAPAEK